MPLVLVQQPSFLGTGFAFPFQLDASGAFPLITSEEDLVRRSLIQLVTTRKGERPFLVKKGNVYGTSITNALFESSEDASDLIQYETKLALDTWEPRVIYKSTQVKVIPQDSGSDLIQATTKFVFRATNAPSNFVVPYRLQASS